MTTRIRGCALLLICLLVATACTGGGEGQGQADAGGDVAEAEGGQGTDGDGGQETFVFLLPDMASTMDPIGGGGNTAYTGNERLSTLVAWDHSDKRDGGCEDMLTIADVRGELAESWEVSEDGTQVTFTLRDGVMSPFGNELTAEDVRWSFERFLAEAPPAAFFYENISKIAADEPFRVLDDKTFQIVVQEPGSMDVALNVFFRLLVHDATEAQKHATPEDPLATEWLGVNSANYGPWHFTEADFVPGQELTMTRNPDYWGETGNIGTLIFRVIPDSSTRAQLLQAGDADFAAFLTYSDYALLSGADRVNVLACASPERDILLLNEADPRFADVAVRQAISMAIDREAIAASAYSGFAQPARDGLHSRFDFPRDDVPQFEYDPEAAKAALAEAGYPDGFTMEMIASPARPGAHAVDVASLLVSQLAEVGIAVDLQVITSGSEFQTVFQEGTYQSLVYNESVALPDPAYALGLYALSNGYQNSFGHADPEFDRLQQQLLQTSPGPERDEYMAEMAAHVIENPPFIYLTDVGLPRAFSPAISGYLHSPYSTTANVYALTKG